METEKIKNKIKKAQIFTFCVGKFRNGSIAPLVIVFKGRQHLTPKSTKEKSICYNHYIDEAKYNYITCLHHEDFELIFGKRIGAGEIKHGKFFGFFIKKKRI